jgi:hypothetical protein
MMKFLQKVCRIYINHQISLEAKGVYRMSFLAFEASSSPASSHPVHGRRQAPHAGDSLLLTELNPHIVVDHLDGDNPVDLTTFGSLRETCPKCLHSHLHLILRQRNVRTAHLFCAECQSCFDAHYPSGAHALTI